jgi:hypothetical protein
MKTKKQTNEFHVSGDELLKKVKSLLAEGNIRKITIKNSKGEALVVFPLTFGVVGAMISPVLAAVGALAALISECTISVERKE